MVYCCIVHGIGFVLFGGLFQFSLERSTKTAVSEG